MKKEETKKPKLKKAVQFVVGGFGADMKFMHWIDPVRAAIGDIGGKVGCRRSSHTRWKKTRAMGYTKKRRA